MEWQVRLAKQLRHGSCKMCKCCVRKRTIFLSDWNCLLRVTQMKPCSKSPADPHFRPRRTDRTTEDHDAENCDASMVLRFALLLSSGHIFYLSCDHIVSPSPLFPRSLSDLLPTPFLLRARLLSSFIICIPLRSLNIRRIYLYLTPSWKVYFW